MPNFFDILKNFSLDDIKKKAEEALASMKDVEITGESGGGFVKVKINGNFNILNIDYEENDFIKQDIKMFRDLIIAAHNDAVNKMREELQKKLAGQIPPGMI